MSGGGTVSGKSGTTSTTPRLLNEEYELVDVSTLKTHPRNARKGDLETIRTSIRTNGFYGALIVQRSTRYILVGNHRFEGAVEEGYTELPVVWADVSDTRALMILAVDNRSSDKATDDEQLLASLLVEIRDEVGDLEGTGFDDSDLDALLDDLMEEAQEDDPETLPHDNETLQKLQSTWGTEPGQIWQAGPHRLMCGDSTRAEDVDALMAGAQAAMAWTDPPYGVNYVGQTKDRMTIANDTEEGLEELLSAAFASVARVVVPGGAVYVAHPAGPLALVFMTLFAASFRLRQCLVWVKNALVVGNSDYHYRHEPILFGYTHGGEGRRGRCGGEGWYGDNAQTSVLEHDKPQRNDMHPTMKPVPLVAQCIQNSAPRGGIVLDLFHGSGTTAVAAEQVGRVCYGMELNPAFLAVQLERLSELGLECTRVSP